MEPMCYRQIHGAGHCGNPNTINQRPCNMNQQPPNRNEQPCDMKHYHFDVDSGRFPIGMGYVPMQKWGDLYSLEQGLCEGTIFVELNQIFCGKRGSRA